MANKKKKKFQVSIPEHDDKALRELECCGIGVCQYAKYEGDHIIGFQRWGRGWRRYEIYTKE